MFPMLWICLGHISLLTPSLKCLSLTSAVRNLVSMSAGFLAESTVVLQGRRGVTGLEVMYEVPFFMCIICQLCADHVCRDGVQTAGKHRSQVAFLSFSVSCACLLGYLRHAQLQDTVSEQKLAVIIAVIKLAMAHVRTHRGARRAS